MVYVARKDGGVVIHTSLQELKNMDGIDKPDVTMTDEEYEAAEGLVRIIDDKIFIGKTDAEKKAVVDEERVRILKRQLAETDYVASKIAEGSATKAQYAGKIAERQAWREEINRLEPKG